MYYAYDVSFGFLLKKITALMISLEAFKTKLFIIPFSKVVFAFLFGEASRLTVKVSDVEAQEAGYRLGTAQL